MESEFIRPFEFFIQEFLRHQLYILENLSLKKGKFRAPNLNLLLKNLMYWELTWKIPLSIQNLKI